MTARFFYILPLLGYIIENLIVYCNCITDTLLITSLLFKTALKLFLRHIAACFIFCFSINSSAQSVFESASYQFGLGTSSLLGDLGGANGKGTNFVRDFDVESVRYSISTSADWALSEHFEYRTSLNYLALSANDKYSEEITRKARNLSVKTNVVELVPSVKYNFFNQDRRSKKRWTKNEFSQIYTVIGLGLIYFNPKTEYKNSVYSLKQLNTEGQSLTNGPKKYSRISIIIPFTLGFRKDITKKSSVFCEFTARKSFSDYLDDVSTVYYDNSTLRTINGNIAAEIADRNTSGNKFKQGTKRGNPDKKDTYFSFTIGYRITLNMYGKRLI